MKKGANFVQRNKIKRMAEAGQTVQRISAELRIEPSVVENFMPDKPKAKRKPKVEKVDEPQLEIEEESSNEA